MPVYRGAGGAGDATNDATVTAVQAAATSAATSATNAANSATAAANSATGAATSATNAANSATTAAGQATTAAGHATNASTFATNSSLSADDSADSATEAAGYAAEAFDYKVAAASSASSASTSATNAAASSATATTAVNNALSLYGDAAALDAAVTAAQLAETNAETAETNAETAATTATNAAATATTQATNAAASAVAADADASAASIDANEAQAAATAAQAAVSNATAIYGSIEDIQQAEANSEANRDAAAASAGAASTSATTATTQAGIATTQANNAATSAAAASAVALGNEPVRHSVRPSLLLDFANTKTLDPRITFTRASTGTFYDGKTTVKAEENLFTFSQEFDNAAWPKVSAIVTANSTTAPDGTTTAETLTETATTAAHYIIQTNSNFTSGLPYIYSVYVKKGTGASARDFIQLGFTTTPFGSNSYANFNISTGSVTLTGAGLSSASITDAGNGWWRCAIFDTPTSTASGSVFITCITTSTAVLVESFAGSVDANVFIWGAQLEQRSSVTAYTATTTAPITNYIPALQTAAAGIARFEHNPVTGESLGLEIEEQRTNLLTYSDDGSNAAWTKTNLTVSSNTIIAPDGTLTGDKLVEDTTAGVARILRQNPTTTAVAHTFSVYAKAGERTWVSLGITDSGSTVRLCWFNLSTGVVGTAQTGLTTSIQSVGNGWYRCVATIATALAGTNAARIYLTTADNTSSYTGDGFSGIYIWGAQLEAGAFATSYVPTVASQVTRSSDAASMTGTNFSSWYRADEGTVYSEATSSTAGNFSGIYSISDGTSSNRMESYFLSGVAYGSFIRTNGVTQVELGNPTLTANTFLKNSSVYKTNDFAYCANAQASVGVDSAGTIPLVNRIYIGAGSTGAISFLNGTIKKLAYYPKRLQNSELVALTTI